MRLSIAAVLGNLLAIVAFFFLPWASGRGALAGRSPSGHDLARMVRDLDVLLPEGRGAPSYALALALTAGPALALAAALLVLAAGWSSRPRVGLLIAAGLSLASAAPALVVFGLLLVGPAAGSVYGRIPAAGSPAVVLGGCIGAGAALAAARVAGRRPVQQP